MIAMICECNPPRWFWLLMMLLGIPIGGIAG